MKKYLLILLLGLSIGCYAHEFQRPDYDTIQKIARTETYNQLLNRFQALDPTLTYDELQTLYYGSIFAGRSCITGPSEEIMDLVDDITKKRKAAEVLDRHLEKYPFDLRALIYRTIVADENDTALISNLWTKTQLVTTIILTTGDGLTDSTGFHVVSISDEYAIMDFFLKVEHGNQYLTTTKCDKFDIIVNGYKKNLYFDIQALLAYEDKIYGGKNLDQPFTFTYDTTVWGKAGKGNIAAMTINNQLELPEITKETTTEEYEAYKPKVIECMDWLRSHNPKTKNAQEQYTNLNAYMFIINWCKGVDDCEFNLEKEFFVYKFKDLGSYYLGGWAAYYAKTGDNDSINGRIAGIETVIECYNNYPKALKKDKKKILKFKQMQEDGTLRQYIIDNIEK